MSEQSAEKDAILDWRDLAPAPERHECDCRFCDMGGDDEPIKWPMLVIADGDGVEYVSDRFMMIRADLAPVPDGYEGDVMGREPEGRAKASGLVASLAGVSNERPTGEHFRWSTLKALELTGWDLRVLRGTDKRVAIVDRDGLPIGVTIVASRVIDDYWSDDFTRIYEHVSSPGRGDTP